MSGKFKVGDKVVRSGDNFADLTKGGEYTVTGVTPHSLILQGLGTMKYCAIGFTLAPQQYPNPPRKHAELIKAWADGATIQVFDICLGWHDIKEPSWFYDDEYRIKPTKSKEALQREESIATIEAAMKVQQEALAEQQAELDKLKEESKQ